MTQKQKLLSHFKKGGKITSFESYTKFGITQLSARISELEEIGVIINRKWVTKNGCKFKEYSYGSIKSI